MSVFFSRIKARLFRNFFLLFILLQAAVALVVVYFHREQPSAELWKSLTVYFLLEATVCLLLFISIKHSMARLFGSQDALSRTLFRNTQNIINNISHEWRTPLNAIMGFTEELTNSEKDGTKLEVLKAISENSVRLFAMSKKLIEFSSIETGQYKVDPQYHRVELLIENLENKYRAFAASKKLRFEVKNDIPQDIRVYFDFHALYEILSMILENAIKFTLQGSVVLSARYTGNTMFFSVADTGIGIADKKKKLVLEVYRQGTSDLDREFEGIGLGLSLALKLVEILKGKLRLSDNSPRGTLVTVELKCRSISNKSQRAVNGSRMSLDDDQKQILRDAALELGEKMKVFNTGKIRKTGHKLKDIDPRFIKYADKLDEAARTFDEAGLAVVVEQMLEDSGK